MLLPYLTARDRSNLHLVLCPFAGASVGAFSGWKASNDLDVTVSIAVYPGRDHRMNERPLHDIRLLAAEVANSIAMMPDEELELVVLAGHSMGAQIAFEACLQLEQKGITLRGLLLSACHAPHLRSRRRLSHLSDVFFVKELISIGGCNKLIRDNPEIIRPFLSFLRADFVATETYHKDLHAARTLARTPAFLLYGSQDAEASREEIIAWKEWLELVPTIHEVAGSHFYITERPRLVLGQAIELFQKQQVG